MVSIPPSGMVRFFLISGTVVTGLRSQGNFYRVSIFHSNHIQGKSTATTATITTTTIAAAITVTVAITAAITAIPSQD